MSDDDIEERFGSLVDMELSRQSELGEVDVGAVVQRILAQPRFQDAAENASRRLQSSGSSAQDVERRPQTSVWTFDSDEDNDDTESIVGRGREGQNRWHGSSSGNSSIHDQDRHLFSADVRSGSGSFDGRQGFNVAALGRELLAEGAAPLAAAALREAALEQLGCADASDVLSDPAWPTVRDGLAASLLDASPSVGDAAERALACLFAAAVPGAFAAEVAAVLVQHLSVQLANAALLLPAADTAPTPVLMRAVARTRLLAAMLPEVPRAWEDLSDEQAAAFSAALVALLASGASAADSAEQQPRAASGLVLLSMVDPAARWLRPAAARAAPLASLRAAALAAGLEQALLPLAHGARRLMLPGAGADEAALALARLEAAHSVAVLAALQRGASTPAEGGVAAELADALAAALAAGARAVPGEAAGASCVRRRLFLACARSLAAVAECTLRPRAALDRGGWRGAVCLSALAGARTLLQGASGDAGCWEPVRAGAAVLGAVRPSLLFSEHGDEGEDAAVSGALRDAVAAALACVGTEGQQQGGVGARAGAASAAAAALAPALDVCGGSRGASARLLWPAAPLVALAGLLLDPAAAYGPGARDVGAALAAALPAVAWREAGEGGAGVAAAAARWAGERVARGGSRGRMRMGWACAVLGALTVVPKARGAVRAAVEAGMLRLVAAGEWGTAEGEGVGDPESNDVLERLVALAAVAGGGLGAIPVSEQLAGGGLASPRALRGGSATLQMYSCDKDASGAAEAAEAAALRLAAAGAADLDALVCPPPPIPPVQSGHVSSIHPY
jgi:hypothetical protein